MTIINENKKVYKFHEKSDKKIMVLENVKYLVNSKKETFLQFMNSDGISGYDFTCLRTKELIPKFQLYYSELSISEIHAKYRKTKYDYHKENSKNWKNNKILI